MPTQEEEISASQLSSQREIKELKVQAEDWKTRADKLTENVVTKHFRMQDASIDWPPAPEDMVRQIEQEVERLKLEKEKLELEKVELIDSIIWRFSVAQDR
uniref:Uncharacterized protein n=2 Tax=Nicotiana TaxID=4085 RepID=A0A1S4B0J3_TOBAC|nr:PREDICTED: uncharacterized protein LOC104223548 [Nicotiana sylvestris]XP_016482465.1 PREDICTED: uncharacterized protein LOC107803289 [Nicotiana tabacum]